MHQKDMLEKKQHFAPVQEPGSRILSTEPERDVVSRRTSRDGIPPHWVSIVITRAVCAPDDIKRLLS